MIVSKPHLTLVALFVASAVAGCSNAPSKPTATAPAAVDVNGEQFGYAMYDELLHKYVDDQGFVNYAELKANREPLDHFIALLGAVKASEVDSWPREAQLAFWINAYNAITLEYIIDHYPIEKGGLISGALYPANSIRQIAGVWDKLTTPVAGTPVTLDHIEHDVLRAKFSEPRIHMAIVCASVGCPPLRNEAFEADRLDPQLDDQAKRVLSNSDRFRVDREKNVVYLSPIFDWFGKDFVKGYAPEAGAFPGQKEPNAAVLNFISKHVSEADATYLRNNSYKVEFTDYDWSLNEQ